jgi:glycosyltransferase involved in cell wall biosynthesis
MKKKICVVVPNLGEGGAERVAFHILNNLNLKKYELILIETQKNGHYLKSLNRNVIKKCFYKERFRYSLYLLVLEIFRKKPDIIITFSKEIAIFFCFLKSILLLKNTKLIVREINIQSKLNNSMLKKFFMRFFYKKADIIVSQSEDMTKDLINYLSLEKKTIVEINNPIDIKFIEKNIQNKNNIFDKEYYNLVCVGRLSYQKGFDLIIKVMHELKKEKIKLYILGEGEERKKLEKLIKYFDLENSVYLLGRVENPYIYMKNADLFILSSRFEGFPNVLLEANTCGLYAICNNCLGGINQIIIENKNGCIIDFSNSKLVANKIKDELKIKHNKNEIKQLVLEKYRIEKIIEKYERLF